jgi:hypothetical protein
MKALHISFAVAAVLFFIPSSASAEDSKMPVGAKGILLEYDSNKDKKIDIGELSQAGDKNMVVLLKKYDKNSDNTITLSELGLTEQDLKEKVEPKKKPGKKKHKKKGKKRRR